MSLDHEDFKEQIGHVDIGHIKTPIQIIIARILLAILVEIRGWRKVRKER